MEVESEMKQTLDVTQTEASQRFAGAPRNFEEAETENKIIIVKQKGLPVLAGIRFVCSFRIPLSTPSGPKYAHWEEEEAD